MATHRTPALDVILLGSGGAFRLPHLSCHCPNCESARRDPRLRRTTTSLWLRDGASILLDAGPDLYQQALREGIERIDAIVLTHAHRDHVLGIECVEPIVRIGQGRRPIAVYGPDDAVSWVAQQFGYMIELSYITVSPLAPGVPLVCADYYITPFAVSHHVVTTFGYRVERGGASLVYLPDIREFPGGQPVDAAPLPPPMLGADLFFADATFDANGYHGSGHITWQEAAALADRSGARKTVLVHFGHGIDMAALRQATTERLVEGYDGQRFYV